MAIFMFAIPLAGNAVYLPYPDYTLGLLVFAPFGTQMLVNLAVTILLVPETLNHRSYHSFYMWHH